MPEEVVYGGKAGGSMADAEMEAIEQSVPRLNSLDSVTFDMLLAGSTMLGRCEVLGKNRSETAFAIYKAMEAARHEA